MQEKNTITLRAIYGKTQGALRLCPVKDSVTQKLLGVKELSDEERRKEKRPVTADTQRKIVDGLVLNLDNETDRIDWEWIKHNEEIADSFDAAQNSVKAMFYQDHPERIIDDRLERKEERFEAEQVIRSASESKRAEIARYLGQNTQHLNAKEVLDNLLSRLDAKGGPKVILDAVVDPQFDTRLFLYQLMSLNKVRKNSDGVFYYGEIVLGLTTKSAINWLDDERNRDIVGKLYSELNKKEATPKTSVIKEFKSEGKPKKGSAKDKNKTDIAGEAVSEDVESDKEEVEETL